MKLECVQQLGPDWGSAQDIQRIECLVPQGAAPIICEPWERKQAPAQPNEAKHSLPYCLALALLDMPITAAHFMASELHPQALALAHKMTWSPLPDANFPEKFQAQISLTFAHGKPLVERVDQVKGSFERPATEAEITAKFLGNSRSLVSPRQQQELMALLLGGPASTPVAALDRLLRPSAGG